MPLSPDWPALSCFHVAKPMSVRFEPTEQVDGLLIWLNNTTLILQRDYRRWLYLSFWHLTALAWGQLVLWLDLLMCSMEDKAIMLCSSIVHIIIKKILKQFIISAGYLQLSNSKILCNGLWITCIKPQIQFFSIIRPTVEPRNCLILQLTEL